MEYAEKFPAEVRLAIDGLGGQSDVGYAVMMLLVEQGPMHFENIRSELDLYSQTLSNHVNKLQKGGLVKKEAGGTIGDQSTGAYSITKFGNRMLDALYKSTQPETEIRAEKTLSEVLEGLPDEYRENKSTKDIASVFSEIITTDARSRNPSETESNVGDIEDIDIEQPTKVTSGLSSGESDQDTSDRDDGSSSFMKEAL